MGLFSMAMTLFSEGDKLIRQKVLSDPSPGRRCASKPSKNHPLSLSHDSMKATMWALILWRFFPFILFATQPQREASPGHSGQGEQKALQPFGKIVYM
jgi:hypothetical protein